MHPVEKFLLPPACLLCGAKAAEEELCAECARSAEPILTACPLCALPNNDGSVCADCSHYPPPWRQALSVFAHSGAIRTLISQWKYAGDRSAGRVLCDALGNWAELTPQPDDITALVPIPMHRQRLRQRGFNQAHHLASALAHHWRLPLLGQALTRPHPTPHQAGLSRAQRLINLTGAFAVDKPALHAHQHLLLVDDVYTTGSTLQACTQLLLNNGVASIRVCTLARALPNTDPD